MNRMLEFTLPRDCLAEWKAWYTSLKLAVPTCSGWMKWNIDMFTKKKPRLIQGQGGTVRNIHQAFFFRRIDCAMLTPTFISFLLHRLGFRSVWGSRMGSLFTTWFSTPQLWGSCIVQPSGFSRLILKYSVRWWLSGSACLDHLFAFQPPNARG